MRMQNGNFPPIKREVIGTDEHIRSFAKISSLLVYFVPHPTDYSVVFVFSAEKNFGCGDIVSVGFHFQDVFINRKFPGGSYPSTNYFGKQSRERESY